jgi:glycosyltransferase involved in cell wall biosynthesis
VDDPNPEGLPDTHPAYPYNVLSYWPALSYQIAEEVLRLLEKLPTPDVIESQEYSALPYFLLQRKLTEQTPLRKIPILVHLHSPSFELAIPNHELRYRFPEYWVSQMEKFCIVAADALLAPSAFLAKRLRQELRPDLDIATIPLPLTASDEPIAADVQPRHIVYVGRLELRKGVLPLVKACARLWEAGEDFRLSMVGGDVDFLPRETTVGTFLRQRYAKWIDRGHLRLVGQVSHRQVLEYMRQGWAVVVPSLWENFPNTCMEAMSVGQVVLGSRAGGQAEMIYTDGVNGFLFDWEVVGDFEQQLRRILALNQTERFAIAQRACARIRALCAPDVVLPQRLQHYETVVARHAPRHRFPTMTLPPTEGRVVESQVLLSSDRGEEQSGLLSIVIPFYNLGEYVCETLDSVLAGTYAPTEIIVVNDGSTEPQSLAVLQEIESRRLPQVRMVHTENRGLASARNTGAKAACGEFLAFVDADDLVEPEFFQHAINILQQYANVTFVYSWVRYFGEATAIWPTWNAEFPYMLGHNMLTPLVVVRRAVFLQHGGNNPEFEYNFEDYEGWLSLLEAGGIGVSLQRPLVHYRVRPGSMYQSSNSNQKLYLYDLLSRRHSGMYRKWGVELFNLQNANGPGHLWDHPAVSPAALPSLYVSALEQQRGKLWEQVQTLGKAWVDHANFIESQNAHIRALEDRCRELLALAQAQSGPPLVSSNGVSWRDREIGGQLVSRVRGTWLARQAMRYPALKKILKKVLRIEARPEV